MPSERSFGADTNITRADIAAFVDSMPFEYRRRYEDDEIRAHAAIVRRRGRSAVHVERAPSRAHAGEWLCFVTDDRPGLLSQLSAVILAHSLDVVTARVYSRRKSEEEREAVDFFLVRSLDGSTERCDDAKLRAIERLTRALLAGEIEVGALAKHAAETSPPTEPPSTNVYFSKSSRDRLVVEAEDRSGLLLTITLALHRAGVSILRSEVTTFAGVARDEFVLAEPSGDPLDEGRRNAVLGAVLSALDPD